MNNVKIFKLLYYLCFILNVIVCFSTFILMNDIEMPSNSVINVLLLIINVILVIIFSILLVKKKKLTNANVLFPILVLVFSIIVIIIAVVFNYRLIIQYIHFGYYASFILFNYLLLNIYSVLSISK